MHVIPRIALVVSSLRSHLFCSLFKLLRKNGKKTNDLVVNLCIIFFIMGASIHLVGDSINHRLSLIGYEFHLSLEDNPIMKKLEPKDLLKSFELLYFYDEVLGHYMWYIPFFICLIMYFSRCFDETSKTQQQSFSTFGLLLKNQLVLLSASYYWYSKNSTFKIKLRKRIWTRRNMFSSLFFFFIGIWSQKAKSRLYFYSLWA